MIFNQFEQTDQFNNSTDVESVLENAFKNADPADFASFDKFDELEFEKVESGKVEAVKDEVIEKVSIPTAKSTTTTTSTKTTTTTKVTTTTKTTTTIKTTTTTAEPCIGTWTSWSDFDSCADRGPGSLKKRRERCSFCSAACKKAGYGAEYDYEYQDCDSSKAKTTTKARDTNQPGFQY